MENVAIFCDFMQNYEVTFKAFPLDGNFVK